MEPNASGTGWLSIIDTLAFLLKESDPEARIQVFLEAIRSQFGWAVAEYWVLEEAGYQITHESHADEDALHRFERESVPIVVPGPWVNPERWRLDPTVTGPVTRRVAWSAEPTLSRATIRRAMIAEAGLKTQVALPVPNRGYLQQIIMLFDTVSRPASENEMNALAIATFLLGWSGGEGTDTEVEIAGQPERKPHLDAQTRRLVGPEAAVRLTVCEWDLLSVFFEREGDAVSFHELTQEVWRAPEAYVGRAVIYEVIARVRKHLSVVVGHYAIKSVTGYGYSLEPAAHLAPS